MKHETDGLTVMLLLAIIYMLLRDRQRESIIAIEQESVIDSVCPYCTFESGAQGVANVRRSLNTHMRQMHPDEWRKLTLKVRQ